MQGRIQEFFYGGAKFFPEGIVTSLSYYDVTKIASGVLHAGGDGLAVVLSLNVGSAQK